MLRLDRTVVPTGYDLELTVDPAKPDFRAAVTIQVRVDTPTRHIWLHGKRLTVARATVSGSASTVAGGVEMTATATSSGEHLSLSLPEPVGPGQATIHVEYVGQMPTNEQEGVFRQSQDGHTYVFTQFEATGARLAMPSFDEPSSRCRGA